MSSKHVGPLAGPANVALYVAQFHGALKHLLPSLNVPDHPLHGGYYLSFTSHQDRNPTCREESDSIIWEKVGLLGFF
jgi:hypothetical protein